MVLLVSTVLTYILILLAIGLILDAQFRLATVAVLLGMVTYLSGTIVSQEEP